METSSEKNDDFDSPWKEMLETYFPEFVAFLFPEIHADIDWSKGYKFLDKELQQVVQDAELGRRYADKLVEVTRKSGDKGIVIVHIEVQGEPEAAFAERMYTYNYRLFDRYKLPIVSLAVLSEAGLNWAKNSFGYDLWGCKVDFSFPVVKLREYADRWAELEASHNPFATVVMAHLKTIETQQNYQARQRSKLDLIRRLYQHGYSREDIIKLFHFIDWMMRLPADLDKSVWLQVFKFEEERRMPYISSMERFATETGREKGLEQGLQKGTKNTLVDILSRLLVHRFTFVPENLQLQLTALSVAQLNELVNVALTIDSLDAFVQQVALLPKAEQPAQEQTPTSAQTDGQNT